MNVSTRRLLSQLRDEGVLQEMADVLTRRYFDDWVLSTPEDSVLREKLHIKVVMIEELLMEFSTILDDNRETENG